MPTTRTIPVTVPANAWHDTPPAQDGTNRPRYAVWQIEVPDGSEWRALNVGQLVEGGAADVVARFDDDVTRARLRWVKGGGTLALVDLPIDGVAVSDEFSYGGGR